MQTAQSGRRTPATLAVLAGALMLGGCATVTTPTPGDPWEGWNRTVFKFNDKVDNNVLKPVARGYTWAVPQPVRSGLTNVFSNVADVYIAANDLLQLKIADGATDIMRVAMNTVFGVGGLFDIATPAGLQKHTADFGLTMAHYGVGDGPYLVLPLLGPSTVRDTAGLAVDTVGNPLSYIHPAAASWSVFGVNLVNTRANLLSAGDVLDAAAIDKYSFIRNAYLQRRAMLAGNVDGGSANQGLPDYGQEALPKYDTDDGSAPAAAAGAAASGAAASSAPASAAAAASGAVAASEASAASGAAVAAPASAASLPSESTVPAKNFVPMPNGVHLEGIHWPNFNF